MNPMQPSKDERMWAMFAHLSGPLGAFLSVNSLSFLGPLIIWLVKKDESDFVDNQGREALNFQLTMLTANLGLGAVLGVSCFTLLPLVGPLFIVVFILQIVLGIIAAVKANDGQLYRYPINIRFIS